MNFFSCCYFVVDFENDLRSDKNFAVQPVSAILSIFGSFASTHPMTLKLYRNIKMVIVDKNHGKKPKILAIWPKEPWEFKNLGSHWKKLWPKTKKFQVYFLRKIFWFFGHNFSSDLLEPKTCFAIASFGLFYSELVVLREFWQ